MIHHNPKTKEEARRRVYGYNFNQRPYNEAQCAFSVSPSCRADSPHQCACKPGFGPDGLYCKQHAARLGFHEGPKITKWKTYRFDNSIVRVECEKETEKYVFIRGRREAKRSEFECYHDSWEAAHEYLVSKCEAEATHCENALERAKENLAKVREMTMEAPDA